MLSIIPADLDDPRVIAMIQTHVTRAAAETEPASAHALDLSGLKSPDVRVWTLWDANALAGIGALKRLSPDHGEIKSMYTAPSARRNGFGRAMLQYILREARAAGFARLSLETGSSFYFQPAVALYRSHGFEECQPFGDYVLDPNSIYVTLELPLRPQLDAS